MATNFGTKIAITGFVRTIATRQLVVEGSLHLRDVGMVTIFGFLHTGCTLAPPGEYD